MSAVNISSQAFAELSAQIFENASRLKSRNAGKYADAAADNDIIAENLRQNEISGAEKRMRGKPVSLHNYAQTYLGPDAVYSLHSFNAFQTAPGIKQYAGDVYNTAVNLNEEPKVLLDFLHKNNKNFDFKI
jgi:hypothetical protein